MKGFITFIVVGMAGRIIAQAIGVDLRSVPAVVEITMVIIYLSASKAADLVEKRYEKK